LKRQIERNLDMETALWLPSYSTPGNLEKIEVEAEMECTLLANPCSGRRNLKTENEVYHQKIQNETTER
jgi:hypothetical protein